MINKCLSKEIALDDSASKNQTDTVMAAIDMGSNSFHMVVAKVESGEVRPIDKFAEKVMLASGLNDQGELTSGAIGRGLQCLRKFSQRTENIQTKNIRCIGTNTLRHAKNGPLFLSQAQKILGCPVDVVDGREEARLIYLGVAHSLRSHDGHRLVFDIGGGSTEFIIGEGFEPILTESLHMGCVSYRERFFPERKITARGFRRAVLAARREVMAIEYAYTEAGWESAVGSSGTVKAIRNAVIENNFGDEVVTLKALRKLADLVLTFDTLDDISIAGVKPNRGSVFPSGLAIMMGIFEQLGIEELRYSSGALREGVLYDMLGRQDNENVCDRTIDSLTERYGVDKDQSQRVEQTALQAFDQARKSWGLCNDDREILHWAACTHEVGLMISHSSFHKHSAYILTNADMPGFSQQDKQLIATVVGNHRRKIRMVQFSELTNNWVKPALRLTLLLRLSVILHRSRREKHLPSFLIHAKDDALALKFPEEWLKEHPLDKGELTAEQEVWYAVGYRLSFE